MNADCIALRLDADSVDEDDCECKIVNEKGASAGSRYQLNLTV